VRSKFAVSFIGLIVAIIACNGCVAANPVRGDQTWLVVSDIHLNPFDARLRPVLFGSDTNGALFRSALAQMRRAVPNPSVVLIPGDFLAHDFAHRARAHAIGSTVAASAVATMATVAQSFERTFPHAQFAIVAGNNDAPCGDYRSALGTAYLSAVARLWAPLVNRRAAAPGFLRDFAAEGHYTATLPVTGLRLIALDDVPLSAQYAGDCAAAAGHPYAGELAWLASTLTATPPGTRNVVMMHIPPGFDAFTTQDTRGFVVWPFLDADANARLLDALSAPSARVAYVIAGHTHRFDFRLDGNVPILVFGSISPVYHNNPAFFALVVGTDGSIRDIETHAFDEWSREWQPARSFDTVWHQKTVDAPSLALLHAQLEHNAMMRRIWDAASNGWPSNWHVAWGLWGSSWREPWCAQIYVREGFARCAGLVGRTIVFRVLLVVIVIGVTTALVLLTTKRYPRGSTA
jgi:predicted phosphodiesterase